jgi:tetratricopeptide (TPR) repeat protein
MRHAQLARAIVALWLNPLDVDARLALGDALQALGRRRAAETEFSAAIALRPDQASGYRLRATARFDNREWEKCVADVAEVLKRSAHEPDLRLYRGVALARLGRHADALPDLTAAVQHSGPGVWPRLERGDAYRALGRTADAAVDWAQAAELAQTNTPVWLLNDLAWRLLTAPVQTRDAARGIKLAKMAHKKAKEDRAVLRTLGVAYYRGGQFKEALTELARVPLLGRDTAYVLFVQSACRAKLGHPKQAADMFRLAVRWAEGQAAPDGPTASELADVRREAEVALAALGIATDPAPPPRPVVRP